MSNSKQPSLHIEWAPGQVRAVNITTGQSGSGARLSDLTSLFSGQREALVGVGRSLVFLKAVRLPKAIPDDLRRILSVQIGQLFPLPSDQLAFDFFQTADQNGDGVLTVVAAMRSQDLTQLHTELQQVGLRASRVLPVALGSAAVATKAGLPDALVIEGGSSGLSYDIVQGGILRYSRVGRVDSDPIAEARRTLAASDAGNLPMLTVGLTLPGAQAVSGTTLDLLHEAPPFAFERTEDRLQAEKKRVAGKSRFAVLMLMAAMLLATLLYVERSDAQAIVTRGQGSWTRELNKLRSIRDTETKKAQLATSIQSSLKSAFQPAQPLSDVATAIGDILPPSVWLTGLSIERGKPMQIRGTAAQAGEVARLVDDLGNNPRFRDVKLVFANSARVDETPVVQFSITAMPVGNLPMPAPVKTRKKATKAKTSQSAESAVNAAAGTK